MKLSWTVSGLDRLGAKLRNLDETIQKREARAAVRAGAMIIRAEALARARATWKRRTGELFRNFSISVKRVGGEFIARVRVGVFYGRFLFGGWRAIGRGKGRRRALRGGLITGKPITGHPVLVDALHAKAQEAVAVVRDRLAAAVRGAVR